MQSSIAIGFSQAPDRQEAAYQAATAVKDRISKTPVEMVILFTSVHYANKEVLDVINSILKPLRLVGASSAGLILSNGIFNRGIAIVAINSSYMNFSVGSATYTPGQEFRQFGFDLARKCSLDYKSPLTRQASVIFGDGLIQYSNQFMLGAQDVLGHTHPLVGILACDDFKFKKTFQFYQQQVLSRSAVGFLVGANSPLAFSQKHGFKPLGKPRTITSVEGSIIRTIDNKPAIHLYEEFLKDDIHSLKKNFLNSPALTYPLGIYLEDQRHYLLRYPVDILNDGSIVCQSDVPANTEVHLTINNRDSCKQAAISAAQEIKDALGGKPPQLLIIFESMVRHKILGRHSFTGIQAIKEVLGHSVPLAGMYSFGEFCHLGSREDNTDTYLQNASLLLMAIA